MPNDTALSFLPNFPSDSATLTRALPDKIYLRGDAAAPAATPDAVATPDPTEAAVDRLFGWARNVLFKDQGQFLGELMGQFLSLAEKRAGISDSDGIGLQQIPHADMMPEAATAVHQYLTNNPTLVPLARVDLQQLSVVIAVLLFRRYLLSVVDRSRAVFFRGLLVSENEVAAILDKAWVALEPFLKSSTTAGVTLEPLRAYKQASADKAKVSRKNLADARAEGRDAGREEERQQQEAAVRAPAPATPTVLVQPAPPLAPKAPPAPAAAKTRKRGKRG